MPSASTERKNILQKADDFGSSPLLFIGKKRWGTVLLASVFVLVPISIVLFLPFPF